MKLIDNIREMWGLMLKDTRIQAIEALEDEFKLKKIYIKQAWIWGMSIPEDYQPKVVEIFQKLLALQIERTQKQIKA